MTGRRALFDSNIIIYLSKKEIPYSYIDQFNEHYISVITYMEILGHRFRNKNEEKFIQELLELFTTLYIDREIADKVIEIRKKDRIKLPDAIIAATAISRELSLITRNTDDFKNIEVSISNPFE
jgi:predicted nucleic acid-binding protein